MSTYRRFRMSAYDYWCQDTLRRGVKPILRCEALPPAAPATPVAPVVALPAPVEPPPPEPTPLAKAA